MVTTELVFDFLETGNNYKDLAQKIKGLVLSYKYNFGPKSRSNIVSLLGKEADLFLYF